jgi:hypothetical protein
MFILRAAFGEEDDTRHFRMSKRVALAKKPGFDHKRGAAGTSICFCACALQPGGLSGERTTVLSMAARNPGLVRDVYFVLFLIL